MQAPGHSFSQARQRSSWLLLSCQCVGLQLQQLHRVQVVSSCSCVCLGSCADSSACAVVLQVYEDTRQLQDMKADR